MEYVLSILNSASSVHTSYVNLQCFKKLKWTRVEATKYGYQVVNYRIEMLKEVNAGPNQKELANRIGVCIKTPMKEDWVVFYQ